MQRNFYSLSEKAPLNLEPFILLRIYFSLNVPNRDYAAQA